MFVDFVSVFHPTPEQKQKQKEFYENLVRRAYKEKWCSTCEHYIPAPLDNNGLPYYIEVGSDCKLGESPILRSYSKGEDNNCELYKCDPTEWKRLFLKKEEIDG